MDQTLTGSTHRSRSFALSINDAELKARLAAMGKFHTVLQAGVGRFGVRFTATMKRHSPVRTGSMKRGYFHVETDHGDGRISTAIANHAVRSVGRNALFPYWWVIEETGFRGRGGGRFYRPRRHRYDAYHRAVKALYTEIEKWESLTLRSRTK